MMKNRHKERILFRNHRKQGKKGFTLVEVLISSLVLVLAIAGILLSYLRCLELNEFSRNSSLAMQAARSRMEQIRATTFAQIKTNFDGITFAVAGVDGMGASYVDDTNARFLEVTVSVSWRQGNSRIYGEDTDVDGVIDAGEDANGNGVLDSPVQLVSRVFER